MDNTRKIDSRLGRVSIDTKKEIFFPQGLIGFEGLKRFSLVEVRRKSPFLLLQSMEKSHFGLVVTDPHLFLPDYTPRLSPVEKKILRKDMSELLVLVTVTIPAGHPEQTALNLSGPVIIDNETKRGLQSPQNDCPFGGQILLSDFARVSETG